MNSKLLREKYISRAKRIVVKIGTNVIGGSREPLDETRLDSLSEQIASLVESGIQVAVVSSGAIGAGMRQFAMTTRPRSLPHLQAAASVGQSKVVSCYDRSFRKHGLHAGQILLTRDDFDSRERYLNASNTVHALFENCSVPIINENDTISTNEIQFGDNDILAAFVTHLIQADLLILLTSAPGLCAHPPFSENCVIEEKSAESSKFGARIDFVKCIDDSVIALARTETTPDGTGGMASKLEAVKIAVEAGEAAVIADGREDNILPRLLEPRNVGTLFLPAMEKMGSRKRWIRFTRRSSGSILIDNGAALALSKKGKSLLPSGIIAVRGNFTRGDTVRICTEGGEEIAKGLTNYSAPDVRKIKGRKTEELEALLGQDFFDEVVHRDNMALA